MFAILPQENFSSHTFEFSLKVIGLNPGYLIKSFLFKDCCDPVNKEWLQCKECYSRLHLSEAEDSSLDGSDDSSDG